jgi:hypothetical protein
MQYVVLLRYGLRRLYPVLRVLRTDNGEIRCAEVRVPCAGMMWHPDGRFRLTDSAGRPHDSQRRTLASINEPLVVYSISGPELLDDALQPYDSTLDVGATVQVSAHAVLEEPTRVALQLVLVKRGDEPYHRETVGDRRIDDGQPDIWIVLARCDDVDCTPLAGGIPSDVESSGLMPISGLLGACDRRSGHGKDS